MAAEAACPSDLPDRRAAVRFALLIRAAKLTCAAGEFLCIVRNVSPEGVSVRTFHPLPRDGELTLELADGGRHRLLRVWEERGRAGFAFTETTPVRTLLENGGDAPRPDIRLNLTARCTVAAGPRRGRAVLLNLSRQGAAVRTGKSLLVLQRVTLSAPGLPDIGARVRWRRGGDHGLSFERAFRFDELAAIAFVLQQGN
jgi:hypothetical protein